MATRLTHLKPGLVTALAAVTLAACAGGVTVSREDVALGYLPEELYVVATGENELRTVIVGDPFDMPKEAFAKVVLASLERQNFGPPLNLSTDPQREDARKRQVVLAFNLTSIKQADSLCSGMAETAKPADTGGALSVTGVYCSGVGGYLTQATARSVGVTGADTEQFRKLMTQLAIALFPDENPHRRQDGPDFVPLP
ncbi:MAG: hypothetical protein O7A62_02525 [Alphaproteobacteria bacterium]|nr:hypothetical protein [Alphaproteobacteria bacterium]